MLRTFFVYSTFTIRVCKVLLPSVIIIEYIQYPPLSLRVGGAKPRVVVK